MSKMEDSIINGKFDLIFGMLQGPINEGDISVTFSIFINLQMYEIIAPNKMYKSTLVYTLIEGDHLRKLK